MSFILAIRLQADNSRGGAEARRFFASVPLCLCVSHLFLVAGCGQSAPAAVEDPTKITGEAVARPGSDWPIFLGPNQDSRSAETGIITKWGDSGLKLVWHAKLGTSYGAPTIAE